MRRLLVAQDGTVRRRGQIAQFVREAGTARTEVLAERFQVSAMTIIRDLDALAADGLIERTRGGARLGSLRLRERNVSWRARQQVAQKHALARVAMTHLRSGMTIAIEDSTTTAAMIPHLAMLRPLTVITNFLPVILATADEPDIELVALGGQFDRNLRSFDGPAVIDQLAMLNADVVLMSSESVYNGYLLHPSADVARRKRAFLECGERRILLLDSTKFASRSSYRVGPIDDFDLVIVDGDVTDDQRSQLAQCDVAVEVAEVTAADIEQSGQIVVPEL